jgi:hypothetical protein
VLLIYHDDAEIGNRREYSRAGSDRNPARSTAQLAPGVSPFTI